MKRLNYRLCRSSHDWIGRGKKEFLQGMRERRRGDRDTAKRSEGYSLSPYFLIFRYRVAWPSPSFREASPMFP